MTIKTWDQLREAIVERSINDRDEREKQHIEEDLEKSFDDTNQEEDAAEETEDLSEDSGYTCYDCGESFKKLTRNDVCPFCGSDDCASSQ